jgi:hypothetical protein
MSAPAGIQRDFGGFDPKFLGITLRIANERARELILGGSGARESIQVDEILRQPEEEAFETLSLLTTSSHEHRHFHDFLLAPFGGLVFRRRVTALLNAMHVLAELHSPAIRRGSDVLPIPFSKWCEKSAPERSLLSRGWKLDDPEKRILPLPVIDEARREIPHTRFEREMTPESFGEHVTLTIDQYKFLNKTFESPNPKLLTRHVSEASAIVVQTQEIWNAFGEDCVNLFLRTLTAEVDSPYGAVLELLGKALNEAGSEMHVNRMSEITLWSLLGDVRQEFDRSQAAVRFAVLVMHLIENGYPREEREVAERFAEWDSELGYPSTLESVRKAVVEGAEFVERLHDVAAEHREQTAIAESFEDAARVAAMFQTAREAVVDRFIADPGSYVHPEAYLATIGDFPKPPVIIEIEGGALAFEHGGPDEGFSVLKGFVDGEGHECAFVVAAPHEDDSAAAIDREAALRLRDNFVTADVLFSSYAVDPRDFAICRDQFAKSGFAIRQVLG